MEAAVRVVVSALTDGWTCSTFVTVTTSPSRGGSDGYLVTASPAFFSTSFGVA